MPKTAADTKNAWNARNYDSLLITVRKGEKDILKAKAAELGCSVNRLVLESINTRFPGLLSILSDESKRKKSE